MARKKPDPVLIIRDLDHADEVLRQLGEVERAIKTIEIQMNDRILLVKADAAKRSGPLIQARKEFHAALAAFGEARKAELFARRRSIELTFGSMGFRLSTKLKPLVGLTWQKVLSRLKNLGLTDGIRVKEEVDREALETWQDERLELAGVRRVQEEGFWIETKEEELPLEGKARVA